MSAAKAGLALFLAALEAVRSYRLAAHELRLLDESGAERLRFTRVADPIL